MTIIAPTQTLIPDVPGFFRIKYQANDRAGNSAEKYRFCILYDSTVTDSVEPILTVEPDTMRFVKGSLFDPYTGLSVEDEVDSAIALINWINITDDIETTRERTDKITLDVVGTYTVTYKSIDTSMNLAEKKRIIIVEEGEEG